MSEAREHLKKLLPHLKVLTLAADIDTLYEVKALIRDADEFLSNSDNGPEPIAEIVYVEEFKSSVLVANDGVRLDDFPVGTKFYTELPAAVASVETSVIKVRIAV